MVSSPRNVSWGSAWTHASAWVNACANNCANQVIRGCAICANCAKYTSNNVDTWVLIWKFAQKFRYRITGAQIAQIQKKQHTFQDLYDCFIVEFASCFRLMWGQIDNLCCRLSDPDWWEQVEFFYQNCIATVSSFVKKNMPRVILSECSDFIEYHTRQGLFLRLSIWILSILQFEIIITSMFYCNKNVLIMFLKSTWSYLVLKITSIL